MKYLRFIILLLLLNILACIGDPRTYLDIYNNRNDDISAYYKLHLFEREDIPEKRLNIQSRKMSGIGDTGLYDPLSKTVNYLIIKDSNGTELMNLRGSSLDNAIKLVSKDEDHILYRLDVN